MLFWEFLARNLGNSRKGEWKHCWKKLKKILGVTFLCRTSYTWGKFADVASVVIAVVVLKFRAVVSFDNEALFIVVGFAISVVTKRWGAAIEPVRHAVDCCSLFVQSDVVFLVVIRWPVISKNINLNVGRDQTMWWWRWCKERNRNGSTLNYTPLFYTFSSKFSILSSSGIVMCRHLILSSYFYCYHPLLLYFSPLYTAGKFWGSWDVCLLLFTLKN